MCGYTQEEVEGHPNSILQGPETDEEILADLMSSVHRGEPTSATLVNYKKGGQRFVNQVKVMPCTMRRRRSSSSSWRCSTKSMASRCAARLCPGLASRVTTQATPSQ